MLFIIFAWFYQEETYNFCILQAELLFLFIIKLVGGKIKYLKEVKYLIFTKALVNYFWM